MTIEIPTEILMSPWAYVIGYFLISLLVVKPMKWFWMWLEEPALRKDDKNLISMLSFFWPFGILLCTIIIMIHLLNLVYSYLIGD